MKTILLCSATIVIFLAPAVLTQNYTSYNNTGSQKNSSCTTNNDCSTKVYGNVRCKNGQCLCDGDLPPMNNACGSYNPHQTGAGNTGSQGQRLALSQKCESEVQCPENAGCFFGTFSNATGPSEAASQSRICACKLGYVTKDNMCLNGASGMFASLASILMLAVATKFVSSIW